MNDVEEGPVTDDEIKDADDDVDEVEAQADINPDEEVDDSSIEEGLTEESEDVTDNGNGQPAMHPLMAAAASAGMRSQSQPQGNFGIQGAWKTICREDGRETIVLPIQGKGVLLQVREEVQAGMGRMVQQTQPILVAGVVLVEYAVAEVSAITDAAGLPSSSSVNVVQRELVAVEMMRKNKSIKNAKETKAGAVVTFQVNQGPSPTQGQTQPEA